MFSDFDYLNTISYNLSPVSQSYDAMAESDKFFSKANSLIDRLDALLPAQPRRTGLNSSCAWRWRHQNNQSWLEPIVHTSSIELDDLKCIERQKAAIVQNTRQFVNNVPANNVLLWGPRGTGKSSLVKAILNRFKDEGLRIIEVQRQYLIDLLDICAAIDGEAGRFIIYCDDLSFAADDPSYKALKAIVDGSISATPDNVLIYATSNRRHLVPEYMSENEQSRIIEGELHLSEASEEKISLSERFGLWLAFHPFNQDQYLTIVDHWITKMGATNESRELPRQSALRWALEHGSRSGRTAWQFARDWTGKAMLGNDE